jgi:hypothetical protein
LCRRAAAFLYVNGNDLAVSGDEHPHDETPGDCRALRSKTRAQRAGGAADPCAASRASTTKAIG